MIRDTQPRLYDIDYLKAIAISLVVFGHIVARTPPSGNEWYVAAKQVVYTFHMPLFMFVSGLLMKYTFKSTCSFESYALYVKRRAQRLLPAYFAFGVGIVILKLAAKNVVVVDNAPANWTDFAKVLTAPYASPVAFLWYIYVLFLFNATLPPMLWAVGKRTGWLLVLGLFLYFLSRTNLLGIGQYCEYFVFFCSGIVASDHLSELRRLAVARFAEWSVFFSLLLIGCTLMLLHEEGRFALLYPLWVLVMGGVSIFFFDGLAGRISPRVEVLHTISKYTFTIYLFNTLCIGLVKGVITKLYSWNGSHFLFVMPLLFGAGIIFPIYIHRKVLSRFPSLSRVTI